MHMREQHGFGKECSSTGASLQTPQSEAGCAGIARARRRGHLAESARPWRCAARGGAISLCALRQDTPRSEVYLTSCSRKKEFLHMMKYSRPTLLVPARFKKGGRAVIRAVRACVSGARVVLCSPRAADGQSSALAGGRVHVILQFVESCQMRVREGTHRVQARAAPALFARPAEIT